MTRFGHKLNYVINTFVKRTPGQFVSCLVGDSRRHIFSWRGWYIYIYQYLCYICIEYSRLFTNKANVNIATIPEFTYIIIFWPWYFLPLRSLIIRLQTPTKFCYIFYTFCDKFETYRYFIWSFYITHYANDVLPLLNKVQKRTREIWHFWVYTTLIHL